MQLTGAEIIIRCLQEEGVEYVFGYPGGAVLNIYDELFKQLQGADVHRAYAGIALPNQASIALHERFGFKRVAHFTEQGRKFDRYWDVGWYEKPLGAA